MFAPMPMYAQPQMQYAQPPVQYAQPQMQYAQPQNPYGGPTQNYPQQQQPPRQQMPSPAYLASGNVPPPQWAPPPSAARMASPDPAPAPKLQPLALPTPESLGIRPAAQAPAALPEPMPVATAKIDWNDVHARLQRLGALRFQLDKLPDGRTRAGFWLPTGPMSAPLPVEAIGDNEASAVLNALQRAETQVASRR
jgi:hypothetical protein